MTSVSLRFHLTVTTTAGNDAVSAHVARVMEELVALADADPRVQDPAVGLDLATGHVEVELLVEAETVGTAADHGDNAVRTAIHAAGGFTPGWDGGPGEAGNVEYDLDNIELQPA